MWSCENTHTSPASASAIFARYADVNRWAEGNPALISTKLEGPFVLGTKFKLKAVSGPAHDVKVTELTPDKSFTVSNLLPGARMKVEHSLEPTADGTLMTHRVVLTGPLSGFWGKKVGVKMQGALPEIMQKFASEAEAAEASA